MNRQKRYHKLFVFAKINYRKALKSHVLVVAAHFSLGKGVFIFLNYCFWVCSTLFPLIVPLESARSLLSFLKVYVYCVVIIVSALSTTIPQPHARVVNDYSNNVSTQTTTMSTSCPRSHRLRQHHVRIVNDYLSMCLYGQQQRQHSVSVVYVNTQFLKISNDIFGYFFLLYFYFFQSKII